MLTTDKWSITIIFLKYITIILIDSVNIRCIKNVLIFIDILTMEIIKITYHAQKNYKNENKMFNSTSVNT